MHNNHEFTVMNIGIHSVILKIPPCSGFECDILLPGIIPLLLVCMFCFKTHEGALFFQAKQRVDVLHLQLQNLLYEVLHLQKEISKCLEFK